jgi:hypothetical protein
MSDVGEWDVISAKNWIFTSASWAKFTEMKEFRC